MQKQVSRVEIGVPCDTYSNAIGMANTCEVSFSLCYNRQFLQRECLSKGRTASTHHNLLQHERPGCCN